MRPSDWLMPMQLSFSLHLLCVKVTRLSLSTCLLSVRYCICRFFLPLVFGAVLCGAVEHSDKLLSVPQGENRCRCILVLLPVLDSASTVGLEQVCHSLTFQGS